jgi:hypothetical protein
MDVTDHKFRPLFRRHVAVRAPRRQALAPPAHDEPSASVAEIVSHSRRFPRVALETRAATDQGSMTTRHLRQYGFRGSFTQSLLCCSSASGIAKFNRGAPAAISARMHTRVCTRGATEAGLRRVSSALLPSGDQRQLQVEAVVGMRRHR